MSTIVTVSGGGLAGTVLTPSTSAILLSLADTAICAFAAEAEERQGKRSQALYPARNPSYFPFTEPSAEVDVGYHYGKGPASARRYRKMDGAARLRHGPSAG